MRSTFAVLVTTLLVAILVIGNANGQTISETSDDAVMKKLDEILRRLDTIESRLAKLEKQAFKRWTADGRGLLLDANGKPVGVWGVDSIIPRAVSR